MVFFLEKLVRMFLFTFVGLFAGFFLAKAGVSLGYFDQVTFVVYLFFVYLVVFILEMHHRRKAAGA